MNEPILVQIIGAPIACSEGIKDSWREVAHWAASKLYQQFGETLQVKYYDLFDPDCPAFPADAQLPLVLLAGEILSSGEKISLPLICRKLEKLTTVSTETIGVQKHE
ncbi:MAG: hypothetical protein K8L91_04800 [Anaerolineae bacterium]|nr:hypothetical protein [Anaerolineae bacterium]